LLKFDHTEGFHQPPLMYDTQITICPVFFYPAKMSSVGFYFNSLICSQCFVEMGDTIGNPQMTPSPAIAPLPTAERHCLEHGRHFFLTAGAEAEVNHQISPRAVCWDPCLNNDGNAVGGLVAGMTTGTGEGSSIVVLVIWRQKSHIGRQESSPPDIFAELGGDFIIDSHTCNE